MGIYIYLTHEHIGTPYRELLDSVTSKLCGALQGSVSSIQMVMASALVLGCATASVTLWYFSRRYVGELALLKGGPSGRPSRLCFSVLDFWGNREVCPLHSWHSSCSRTPDA